MIQSALYSTVCAYRVQAPVFQTFVVQGRVQYMVVVHVFFFIFFCHATVHLFAPQSSRGTHHGIGDCFNFCASPPKGKELL
jgi:hypothetical protein